MLSTRRPAAAQRVAMLLLTALLAWPGVAGAVWTDAFLVRSGATISAFAVHPESGVITVVVVSGQKVLALQLGPDGEIGPTVPVSPPPHFVIGAPDVAVDAAGNATIVWPNAEEAPYYQVHARRLLADGTLEPETLTLTDERSWVGQAIPVVAMTPEGVATVAWNRRLEDDESTRELIEARRIDWSDGGTLGDLHPLSPSDGIVRSAQIVVDDAGKATVTWRANVVGVRARQLDADGTLSPLLAISPSSSNQTEPILDIDPDGLVTVVWRFPSNTINVRQITPDGDLRQDAPLVVSDGSQEVVAASTSDGRAITVYERLGVRARTVMDDGSLADGFLVVDAPVPDAAMNPAVAANARGDALIAWIHRNLDTEVMTLRARYLLSDGSLTASTDLALSLGESPHVVLGGTPTIFFRDSALDLNAVQDIETPASCNDVSLTTFVDEPVDAPLGCTGSFLTLEITAPPSNGTTGAIDQDTGVVEYSPDDGFVGNDSFTYQAVRPGLPSDPAEVSVTVDPWPLPICADVAVSTPVQTAVSLLLDCTGFIDAFELLTEPTNGTTADFDADAGTVEYRPAGGFAGEDALTYRASGPGGASDVAEATITVVTIAECDDDELSDCADEATCTDLVVGFECTCNSGFVGDGVTCDDVDECADDALNDCDVNATCTNAPGSYGCRCDAGYAGDGTACTDIDECAEAALNGCDANAVCTNEPGTFSCTCPAGFSDERGDGTLCAAICGDSLVVAGEECDDGNDDRFDGCSTTCQLEGPLEYGGGSACEGCSASAGGRSAGGGLVVFWLIAVVFYNRWRTPEGYRSVATVSLGAPMPGHRGRCRGLQR